MSDLGQTRVPDWRPGRWILLAAGGIVVLLAGVLIWDGRLDSSADRAIQRLDAERRNADGRIRDLTKELDKATDKSRQVEKRARAIERRVGPVLRKYRDADARRDRLSIQVKQLRSQFDEWVEVPDIGLQADTVAQSMIEDAGLTWTTESIEGSCADYQDHFIDRGYGWSDVVKQEPSPGSRMAPGGSVTIFMWDFYSGWELGCETA